MTIGYLINTYPMTSQTFIYREILALEAAGVDIARYSIRRWPERLVDAASEEERGKTRYILSGRSRYILIDFLSELLSNPLGVMRSILSLLLLIRNSGGDVVRNVAYFLEAATLKRWVEQDGVRHIHAHFSTNSATVAYLCRRMGGPPYSFTAHGLEEFDNAGTTSLTEKVANARFVVAITHFCRAQLARAAGMEHWDKIHVVRCGIDVGEFTPSPAPLVNDATFVCVGRLCLAKAQTLLVDAARIVADKHPQVRILLIGDGETRADVEARIHKHGLQQEITLLGWRSNAEVRDFMTSARALLATSIAEGLPLVIIESLALARPVITTFVAGIPELVDEDCGWIVPAGSVEDIAAAMIDAIETPVDKLARMGNEGRTRVMAQHDVGKNAEILQKLFTSACATGE